VLGGLQDLRTKLFDIGTSPCKTSLYLDRIYGVGEESRTPVLHVF